MQLGLHAPKTREGCCSGAVGSQPGAGFTFLCMELGTALNKVLGYASLCVWALLLHACLFVLELTLCVFMCFMLFACAPARPHC